MKILGISGKKSGGKNTAANWILGINLVHYGIVRGACSITPEGQLSVSDVYGEVGTAGILNQDCSSDEMWTWWQDNVHPFIKIYSFAQPLKQLSIDILGLTPEQCYGTDDQKNSVTNLRWEDMPGILNPIRDGFMTGREVLQHVGTDIFRKMYHDVWVDTTLRQIQIEQPELAIICDARFPNEITGIKNAGGKVIRLTRSPFSEDEHASEKALDEDNFDWGEFDAVIDNADMTIEQQNKAVYECLRPWGYLPEVKN